jgi:hypothetical protein
VSIFSIESKLLIIISVFVIISSKRNHVLLPHIDKISREIFGPDCPPASELELKTQLALVSTHPAIDYVEPLPPNVISVGGLQIKEAKKLPKVAHISLDTKFACISFNNLFLFPCNIFRTLTISLVMGKRERFCSPWVLM